LVSVYFPEVSIFEGMINNSELNGYQSKALDQFEILTNVEIREDLLKMYDLMLVSIEHWTRMVENQHKWLLNIPSVLILTS